MNRFLDFLATLGETLIAALTLPGIALLWLCAPACDSLNLRFEDNDEALHMLSVAFWVCAAAAWVLL